MSKHTQLPPKSAAASELSGPVSVRVLHIDDEPAFAEMAATYVEREGESLAVESETEASDALTRLTERPDEFDVVLADYDMPGLDGIELFEELTAAGCQIPYVLYTGNGSEDIASRAISAGVTDYIPKETGTDHYAVVANRLEQAAAAHQTRTTLNRNEEYYRQLIEAAPVPVTMYDETGTYLYANSAAVTFLGGETHEDIVGRTKYHFISPAERSSVKERLSELAAGKEIPASEHAYTTLDGRRRTAVASCGPAVFHENAVGVSILRNTSTETEAASPLEDVASVLSHDIRSPLNVVAGRLDLAVETGDVDHLEDALPAIDRTHELVDDVIEVLRNEAITVDPEPVDIEAYSCRLWQGLSTGDAAVEIGSLPTIRADPDALARLIENLLRNAVEHAGPAPTVTVGRSSEGFYVADDGPGIPADDRDRVFNAGYSDGDGSGLGLVSVKQVTQVHGWEITYRDASNGGARFDISGVERVDGPPS